MLGAALLAPLLAATCATPAAAGTWSARTAWDTAARKLEECERRAKAAEAAYARAEAVYKSALVPAPTKAIKREVFWLATDQPYLLHGYDLDEHARRIDADGFGTPESRARSHADVQAIRDWRAADQRLSERTGYGRAAEAVDEAWDRHTDQAWTMLSMPAPDLAAVSWKLEYLWGDRIGQPDVFCDSYKMEPILAIMADVRRLFGEAQA